MDSGWVWDNMNNGMPGALLCGGSFSVEWREAEAQWNGFGLRRQALRDAALNSVTGAAQQRPQQAFGLSLHECAGTVRRQEGAGEGRVYKQITMTPTSAEIPPRI